jgi:PAS domain S-box-containing protein
MIKYLDLISLAFSAIALIVILYGWKHVKINLAVRLLHLALSLLFSLYYLLLFLEWSGIRHRFEGTEDYLGAMLPLVWLFLFYSILSQLKEHDLSRSKERFQSLIESTSDWIWEANRDLIFTYSSPQVKYLLGYEPQEIVGRKITDIVNQEDIQQVERIFGEALQSGKPIVQAESWLIDKDGQKKLHEISSFPFFDNRDTVQGFRTVSRDITERKRAQLALSLSEQSFRAIANYTYSWEIWLSSKGTHFWTNPAVERITGYTVEECTMIAGYPRSLVYQEDLNIYDEIIKSALNQSSGKDKEIRIKTKDGNRIWVSVSWQPIYDDRGNWQGVRLSLVDCEERKVAQELLAEKKEELESILYATSHDFRTPIINIDSFTYILRENVEQIKNEITKLQFSPKLGKLLHDGILEIVNSIHDNVRRLDTIVTGLLQVSRIEEPKPEQIDNMNEILTKIVELFSHWTNEISAKINIKPLPGCIADRSQVKIIFIHLISNSLKFQQQGRPLEITISGRKTKFQSIYCIEDNGMGIPDEYQPEIFKMFHQVSPEHVGGKGIGLTLCSRLAHRNGGKIWVKSEQGSGSKFFVALPQIPSTEE